MAEMAVQGLLEFWPFKSVNKLISGCLYQAQLFGDQKCLRHPCLGNDIKECFNHIAQQMKQLQSLIQSANQHFNLNVLQPSQNSSGKV